MARKPVCAIEVVRNPDDKPRGIGLVVCGRDSEEKAIRSELMRKGIQTAFDYWIDNFHAPKRWHYWDASEFNGLYTQCVVFKDPPIRIYGFRCHPRAPEDRRHECSVLVISAAKYVDETDPKMLDICEEMRCKVEVQHAVKIAFRRDQGPR